MIHQKLNHKFQNANINSGVDLLMSGEKADIFYSDPPWGDGNIRYWSTINKRHNNQESEVLSYNAFLNSVFQIASKHVSDNGIIVIEYGRKWVNDVISLGLSNGLVHLGVVEISYKSGNKLLPHHMHFFSKTKIDLPAGHLDSLKGRTGLGVMVDSVKPWAKEKGILLDPCCGLGLSLRLAIKIGYSFRGNELNITRLSKTMSIVDSVRNDKKN
jgi:hypothetical protein